MYNQSETIKYIKTKTFFKRFIVSFLILADLILWIQNYSYFYEMLKVGGGLYAALISVYDIGDTFDNVTLTLVTISVFLTSISIALFLKYITLQSVNKGKEVGVVGSVIFLTTLMAQCMSCTTAIFGTLISTSFLFYLPFKGLEISIVAIIILLYNIFTLSKKINNPYVC